ncbi:MAG: hypothetical protein ACYTJ0_16980, partial [Planctomycetota bacterium]
RAPQGGVGGFGGGGGGACEYAHDDGVSETALGQAGAGTVGMANYYTADPMCPMVNVIEVAWGPHTAPQPVTVAIYADPNGDGDPSDVTVADLIVQASGGSTAFANTDILVSYPIPDTMVPAQFFVVAITEDIGDGEFPAAIDTTASAASSWLMLGIGDVDDPFQDNGFLNLIDNVGFAGNFLVRAAFAGDECDDCFNVVEGTYSGSTANLTGSTGDDTSCAGGDTIDAWYCYTASCNGTAVASLCDGTDYDSTIAAFDACDGTEIACDDDGCGVGGGPSLISFPTIAGATYYIRVSGLNGDSGNYTLDISCEGDLENDDCADALPIEDGVTPFNTLEATTDGPENPEGICNDFGQNQTYNDIWYDYTASCDGTLLVTTCEDLGGSANYDTDLVIYSGTECPVDNDRLVACNDDDPDNPCGDDNFRSTIRIPVVTGETYKIRVGGWGPGDSGIGQLLVDCDPANDLCENALPIGDGLTAFDTTAAETDGPENPEGICNDFGQNQTYNDIWFDYTATCTGELLVTTCEDLGGSAEYDSDIVVYAGTDCPVDTDRLLGCNDDDPDNPCGTNDFHSTVRVPVVAGASYKIRVGGWGPNDRGTGELLVECTDGGPTPVLNEIRIDQPGGDADEYLELRGEPGTSLDGLSVIVIGDGPTGSGTVEEVIDLGGNSIPAGGYFLIAEDDVFGVPADLIVPDMNFENSDNVTFVLALASWAAVDDDLDVDDDCVLDSTPWSGVIDALGLVEDPDGGDCNYGASLGFEDIGPDGTFVPAQVFRCVPDGAWEIGSFFPEDGTDTPRADNLPCCRNILNLAPGAPINPLGYLPGDEIVVHLSMSVCELVAGFQAFVSYDPAELTFVEGHYTAEPFGQPIIDPIMAVGGAIDLAAGIDQTIGQAPTDEPAVLAVLTFTAEQAFCLPSSLAFRDTVPPSRFSDPSGNSVDPLLTTELAATCKSDVDRDGVVGIDDLMFVVQDYNNEDPCNTDVDGNGVVDVDDLVQVILDWGPCF